MYRHLNKESPRWRFSLPFSILGASTKINLFIATHQQFVTTLPKLQHQKTTPIRRVAARGPGVSRHHGGSIEDNGTNLGLLWKPLVYHSSIVLRGLNQGAVNHPSLCHETHSDRCCFWPRLDIDLFNNSPFDTLKITINSLYKDKNYFRPFIRRTKIKINQQKICKLLFAK